MNPEKKIQIELDKDVQVQESTNISRYQNASDFPAIYKKLQDNGIDIFDPATKIIKKQSGEYYIAKETNNQNVAYLIVENSDLLKSMVSNITRQNTQIIKDMGGTIHDHSTVDILRTAEGKEEIILTLQKELTDLQKEIITFKQIDKACAALLLQYNEVRKKLEGAKSNPPKEWMKNTIYQNNLAKLLDVIKTQRTHIEDVQKKSAVQRVSAFQENTPTALAEWKAKLDYIHGQFSSIDKYFLNPDHAVSNDVDITAYNIDTPLYQAKDVEKLLKKVGAQREEIKKINELQFNLDLTKIDEDEQQRFRQYLNGVLTNTIDPAMEKFVPENNEKFAGLLAQYPRLTQYFSSKKPFEAGKEYVAGEGLESLDPTDPKFQEAIKNDPRYNDRKEALGKGGLAGLASFGLDKTNMTPQQKQFRGGVGQLAMVGGAIFVGRKMLSSAFGLVFGTYKGKPEEKRKAIAWLLGPAAIIFGLQFGLQAATGEGVGGIIHGGKGTERLANLFGGKKTSEHLTPEQEKSQKEFLDKYGEGMVGAISVFHGMNYGQIKELVEQKDGKMKLKAESYETFLQKFGENNPNVQERNPAAVNFLKTIGKNDDNNIIDLSLNAMGLTWNKLNDPNYAGYEINEAYARTSAKVVGLVAFMEAHLYARINPNMMKKIEDYLADENATYADLEKLAKENPDLFLKKDIVDETGITGMADTLRTLAGGDKDKEAGLIIGMNMFYEYLPTAEKKIELIGSGPEIQFKTYGQTTKINIDSKTLVGFTPKAFDSYFELFKAANLTNRIQDICKDKVSVKTDPFYISGIGNIMFNTAEVISLDRDFNVQTAGMFGRLDGISPILEKYKTEYAAYLNGIRNRKIKPPEVEVLDTLPAALVTKMNTIIGSDPDKEKIMEGLQRFYTNRPTAEREMNIDISGSLSKARFTTYGQTTIIDIKDRNIVDLHANAPFADHTELFRAANLTNYIKSICKSKETNVGNPYGVSTLGNITFDDKGLGTTKVLEANSVLWGLFSTLDKVSGVLSDNKALYVNYLNTTWDRTGNSESIKRITRGNQGLELKILEGLNLFRETMPSNRQQPIKITGTADTANFETYGKAMNINLNQMSIKDLGCNFETYFELFKAASLTNRLKLVFSGRKNRNDPNQFNISFPGGDIEFDGEKVFDIEAVSAGRWGSLGKISPKLEERKTDYVKYLNTLSF